MKDTQGPLSATNSSALADLFCRMVKIDSESGNEDRFIDFIADIIRDELGGVSLRDHFGNLIGRVPAKASAARSPVLLCAHADTVCPGRDIHPIISSGTICTSGDTVLGADDKAGILEILAAVAQAKRRPEVEILITRCEETGLLGSRNLDRASLNSKIGFVVDLQALDAVVVGGPRHYFLDIGIAGRAAHAGVRPEKGISAIKAASVAIASLPDGRVDSETTWNAGIIEGGHARNVVADHVKVIAECRSLNDGKAEALATLIRGKFQAAAEAIGATAVIATELQYAAYHIPEDALPVIVAKRALQSGGIAPRVMETTGATDAVLLNAIGIEAVAVGFGGQNAHTHEESIAVCDMLTAVGTLRYILEELA